MSAGEVSAGWTTPDGFVIAIDGPAGSGKSSVSRGVAGELGLGYLDSGATYRALTWWVLRQGVDPADPAAVTAAAVVAAGPEGPVVAIGTDPASAWVRVDGTDVTEAIRGADVTAAVSIVAAVPDVRARLVRLQRALVADACAAAGGVVVEGRDIGSVVLPDADLKVFLTADPAVRAQRRHAEDTADTASAVDRASTGVADTERQLRQRDALDSGRTASPLTRAAGSVEVDATHLTLAQVIDAVVTLARSAERGEGPAAGAG